MVCFPVEGSKFRALEPGLKCGVKKKWYLQNLTHLVEWIIPSKERSSDISPWTRDAFSPDIPKQHNNYGDSEGKIKNRGVCQLTNNTIAIYTFLPLIYPVTICLVFIYFFLAPSFPTISRWKSGWKRVGCVLRCNSKNLYIIYNT